MLSKNGKGIK